jgi:hypothetical protein
MAAVRVSFTWWGTQRTLTVEQRNLAAEAFQAEGQSLSASKKLIDTKHEAFRAVTAIRTKINDAWKSRTLPFPEAGVRLIRQDRIETFASDITALKAELDEAVLVLDQHYAELRRAAAARLGSLYNPADYPETLVDLFGVTWDFPNVEAPPYLLELSPALYFEESKLVAARFEEAVRLAEQAFLEEFGRLVEHLTERITGSGPDGLPKIFRDSVVNNLTEFFERFRSLNVRSNPQLDQLVERAQRAIRGVGAQALRDSEELRAQVASQFSRVQAAVDGMLVDRPRRRILRQASGTGDS